MEHVFVVERWVYRSKLQKLEVTTGLAGAFSTHEKAEDFIKAEKEEGSIRPDSYSISQVWFDRAFSP